MPDIETVHKKSKFFLDMADAINIRCTISLAIAKYKNALALGGSKPLPELFKAARLEFDFSQKTIEPLMKAVADELQKPGNCSLLAHNW